MTGKPAEMPLRVLAAALLAGAACAVPPAGAQTAGSGTAPAFVYADIAQGKAVLGARDDYVRATSPLERSAKLKTAEAVDEERFLRHMREATLEWTGEQKKALAPLIEALSRFLGGIKWKMPDRILLVQSGPLLEDGYPHTRANAIVSPAAYFRLGPRMMAYVLSHETFHVLSRYNPELREKLYAVIGFARCETVLIPPEIERLRITNPDMVESRHTIAVRYQGRPVHALPYIRFPSDQIDPREGFMKDVQVEWLLMDRMNGGCRARSDPVASVPPDQLDGLFEQVGRNTDYLFHPEEILADNFVHLFLASLGAPPRGIRSPEILKRISAILFE